MVLVPFVFVCVVRYGSIYEEVVDFMFRECGLTAEDRFLDIGSGIGQIVTQAAAWAGCSAAVSIAIRIAIRTACCSTHGIDTFRRQFAVKNYCSIFSFRLYIKYLNTSALFLLKIKKKLYFTPRNSAQVQPAHTNLCDSLQQTVFVSPAVGPRALRKLTSQSSFRECRRVLPTQPANFFRPLYPRSSASAKC